MLREALSASSDDARPDLGADIEFVPDDVFLGHDLVDASPEVRLAAVRRSRRIPEPSTMRAAWASLPLDVRDRIGVMALSHAFYSVTMAEFYGRVLDREGARKCETWSDETLNGVEKVAIEALPGLFGTPDTEPLWACRDGFALALQVGAEAEEA